MMTLLLSWGGIQQSPSRQSRQFQERTTHQITSHLYSGVLPKMRCPHQVLSMGAMRLAPSPPLLVPSLLLLAPSCLLLAPSPSLLAPSPLPLLLPMADTMSPTVAMSNLARTSPISPSIVRMGGWTTAAVAM